MSLTDVIEEYTTEKERSWLALMFCLYALLWLAFKLFFKDAKGKELSLAHPIISFVATIQLTKFGFVALFDGTMMELSSDAYTRLKADHDGFSEMAQLMFAYELFNTLSSILVPQYRTAEFLGHHMCTTLIAKLSQTHGPEFYGLFYFGIASLSSPALCVVDFLRHGPPVLADTFPTIKIISGAVFALSFFAVRSFAWQLVSLVFWHDTIMNLRNPPEGGGTWRPYLIMLLLSNTFLGGLQLVWTKRIWSTLMKTLSEHDKKKSN
mmetsp:Transcript_555/g.856  ORF Transcript_555/g.856 Transcript_555/m.856 type:complete len:265 (+) Transcript_555:110-904(+)